MSGKRRDRHALRGTCIRFPEPVHDQLKVEADARELSVNYLVNQAVAEFLKRLVPAEEFRLTR